MFLTSVLFWACVGVVLGALGQLLILPCFLGQLVQGGPFFVLWWCSFLFNVYFWTIVLWRSFRGSIPRIMHRESLRGSMQLSLAIIGLSDALNGILLVFATPNTPNDLQGPLLQATIPMTLIASYFVKDVEKRYMGRQLIGAAIALAGIFIALVPTINDAATNTKDRQFPHGAWWAAVFIASCIPAVLMTVYTEAVFNRVRRTTKQHYDKYLLLAWESMYQLVFMTLFWGFDWINGFGASGSAAASIEAYKGGFRCFFGDIHGCDYTALLGLAFAGMYIVSYIFQAAVADRDSANLASLVAALANPFGALFWIAFPEVNRWCGGSHITKIEAIWAGASIPVIVAGTVIFKIYEQEKVPEKLPASESSDADEFNSSYDQNGVLNGSTVNVAAADAERKPLLGPNE